ncbi:MAG: hypothetical protein Q9176_004899 [Flavoplaca citrina]
METELTLEAMLDDADFRPALPHFVLKHLSILDHSGSSLRSEPDNSKFILDTMTAELSIVIKYWGRVLVSEVLGERIKAIQPLITAVDDYEKQALHLLVDLLRLNLKLLKTERYLQRLTIKISCKRNEL